MNDNTRGSGGRLRRAGALAGITLLLAACGGGRSSTAAGLTNYQKALAFSECMRSHGLPDYPDPNSQGGILISNGSETGTPQQFASASKACDHLLPNGGQETPAQTREDVSADLKIAACMRSHGITTSRIPPWIPSAACTSACVASMRTRHSSSPRGQPARTCPLLAAVLLAEVDRERPLSVQSKRLTSRLRPSRAHKPVTRTGVVGRSDWPTASSS